MESRIDRCAKFKRIGKLGQGTFGTVYKAENIENGQIVALKRIRFESDQEGVPCTAIREISLLKELDHENIVKLYEIIHDPDKLTLVFEFCDLDLKKYLDQCEGKLPTEKIKDFLYQLCVGVTFCHKERVLHRDLKPQNLLITKSPNGDILKLADFGLARGFSVPVRSYSHEVVTLWYRAPEVLLGSHTYSKPIDIWSIGCIMCEMFTGVPIFKGRNVADEINCIFSVLGTPNVQEYPAIKELPQWPTFCSLEYSPRSFYDVIGPRLDAEGFDLLNQMLCYDPLKRLTAQKILDHPYLSSIKATKNIKK